MQESSQIFEEPFRERERGRVEGNKEVYIKLREPIPIGSKEEKINKILIGLNQKILELLAIKRHWNQDIALKIVRKKALKPWY